MQAISSVSPSSRIPNINLASPSFEAHQRNPVLILDTLETSHPERLSRLETGEEVKDIVLSEEYIYQVIKIGKGISKEIKEALMTLIWEFKEVFAWATDDGPEIPHELMIHRLNMDPIVKLVQQKNIHFSSECSQAIFEEIDKLLASKMIWESSTWPG